MSTRMLSIVAVVRNCVTAVPDLVAGLSQAAVDACMSAGFDHEVLLVDDGSTDGTFEAFEALLPTMGDVRAIALVSPGNPDAAYLAGMEHALGDWIILVDPMVDNPTLFAPMLAALAGGADVVLADDRNPGKGAAYGVLSHGFVALFRAMTDIDLRSQASSYRGVSRRVVSYVTAHDNAAAAHRALPMMGGFRTRTIPSHGEFIPLVPPGRGRPLRGGVQRAMALMTATSTAPLRLATATCAATASLSLAYSLYVAVVYLLGTNVAPGWTTMSLQISGMFFLLAISVALLSEYVLQISASSHRRPPYHMVREVHGTVTRERRLNVV